MAPSGRVRERDRFHVAELGRPTARWSCCCTGSRSSGGRGVTSWSAWPTPGSGPWRLTCAVTAPATNHPAATTLSRWLPTWPRWSGALGGRTPRGRSRLGRAARLDDGRPAPGRRRVRCLCWLGSAPAGRGPRGATAAQRRMSRYLAGFQCRGCPTSCCRTARRGQLDARRWGGPGSPMPRRGAPHARRCASRRRNSALEYYRWVFRSRVRRSAGSLPPARGRQACRCCSCTARSTAACCPQPRRVRAVRHAALRLAAADRRRALPARGSAGDGQPSCCSSMRARDALGRIVPDGSPDAVEPVSEEALPAPGRRWRSPRSCLTRAARSPRTRCSKRSGRPALPANGTTAQGLAQLCVGVTHLQRGNREGAVTLLRRGAGHLTGRLAAWGQAEADRLAAADPSEPVPLPVLRLRDS